MASTQQEFTTVTDNMMSVIEFTGGMQLCQLKKQQQLYDHLIDSVAIKRIDSAYAQ